MATGKWVYTWIPRVSMRRSNSAFDGESGSIITMDRIWNFEETIRQPLHWYQERHQKP